MTDTTTPPRMRARYAIIEALHTLAEHPGPEADCDTCHQGMADAVRHFLSDEQLPTGELIAGPDPVMCVGCYLEHRAGTRHLDDVNDATLIVSGNSTCTDHIQIGPAPAIPGRTASGIIIGEGN